MEKITKIFAGLSAEYFVAAELSRRNFCASITLKNTPKIDIVAVSQKTKKMYCIQVKAKQRLSKTKKWLLKKDDEEIKGKNYFYAFVNLNMKEGKQPDIYIVSEATVSKRIKKNHEKKGGKEKVNMREFILQEGEEKKYQNWDILK
jgi:nitrate reductase alpha subunit